MTMTKNFGYNVHNIFTIFLQQILSGKLLRVVISERTK